MTQNNLIAIVGYFDVNYRLFCFDDIKDEDVHDALFEDDLVPEYMPFYRCSKCKKNLISEELRSELRYQMEQMV